MTLLLPETPLHLLLALLHWAVSLAEGVGVHKGAAQAIAEHEVGRGLLIPRPRPRGTGSDGGAV